MEKESSFVQWRFVAAALFISLILCIDSGLNAQVTLSTSPYTQNFNSIGSGLPTGWTVRTGATETNLGTTASFVTTATAWATTNGQFRNSASANSPASSGDNATTQSGRSDRALSVRQSGSFGDPGAAFVLQLANTTGLSNFELSFKLMSLATDAGRTTTWNVDYGVGASPGTFTDVTTSPATITTNNVWGSTFVTVDFGSALNNISNTVWIRIVAKSSTSGSGSRPVTGIDDVSLSFSSSSCTAPSSQVASVSANNPGVTGFDASFTRGTEDGSILVLRPGAQSAASPVNGTSYTASTDWSSADQINTDNRVVAKSTAASSSVVNVSGISGLSAETEYTITGYEYIDSTDCYNTSSAPSASIWTLSNLPGGHAASFTSAALSSTSIKLDFSAANTISNADGYLIYRREGATPTFLPIVATAYSAGNSYGDAVLAAVITNAAAVSFTDNGLSASTSYYYTLIPFNWNGSNAATYNYRTAGGIPTTFSTTLSPAPEVDVRGNGISITNGDLSPSATDYTDFGTTNWGGSSIARTFTIHNTGDAALTLAGASPYITISGPHASDFSLTSVPAGSVGGGASTSFQITFTPSAQGVRSAVVSFGSNDSDENPFTFSIQGTAAYSNLSDISDNTNYASGSPEFNINPLYANYTSNDGTSSAGKIIAMKLRIRDGGAAMNDADDVGTTLSELRITVKNTSGANRISFIRKAVLTTTAGTVIKAGTVSGSEFLFNGMSGAAVTADDDNSKILHLRISFDEANVVDNEKLVFQISSATAGLAGSLFATSDAGGAQTDNSTGNDRNRIEVVADRIVFSTQPVTATVNVNLAPFAVEFVDANGRLDFDSNRSLTLTESDGGIDMNSSSPYSVTAPHTGIITFTDVKFTSGPQNNISITATTSGLAASNSATSSQFSIVTFTYLAGDFRPLYDTDFSYNGQWEYFNGSSWGAVPDNRAPQNTTSYIGRILVDKNVTGGGNTTKLYNADIIVMPGGVLTLNDDDNPPVASQFIGSGYKLEVLAGGTLVIQGDIDLHASASLIVRSGGEMVINQPSITNTHPMWDGTEIFEGGSTLTITNWNFGASATVASIVNVATAISSNANGYKFGNLILDVNTGTNNWTLVGGPVGIINLCENNLEISNSGSGYILGATNATGSNGFIINGNLTIYDGNFSFGSSFSNNAFNHNFTINGDFTCISDDELRTHFVGSGTPASINGWIRFKGNVTVGGDVTSFSSYNLSTKMRLFVEGGTSADPLYLSIAPVMTGSSLRIVSGSYVRLKDFNLIVNSFTSRADTILVEDGASLHFGWNPSETDALYINKTTSSAAGTNRFISQQGSTLIITSPDGIATNGTGNVRFVSSNITYDQLAVFHYVGKVNQVTGNGLTTASNGKIMIVELENPGITLTMTNSTGISNSLTLGAQGGSLQIIEGTLITTATERITGTGRLMMSGGHYKLAELTTVPQLQGSYSITGGTVELNGVGAQVLRGSRDYYSLTFSGSGIKTLSGALPAGSLDGLISISDAAILDVSNYEFSGDAGLSMSGTSRFRISALNLTQPRLTGINYPYTLSGGTIELYGTSSTQSHSLRGTFGTAPFLQNVSYYNVELNAFGANTGQGAANVVAEAGFGVQATFTVNAPACFRLASDAVITDQGSSSSFVLAPGATLKYGGTIEATGATGNIRTDIRDFSSSAGYGFVGAVSPQIPGTGLPSSVSSLIFDKTTALGKVELQQNQIVTDSLKLFLGKLDLSGYELSLGTASQNAVISGASSNSYIIGWNGSPNGSIIHRVNALTSSYDFPIGDESEFTPATLTLNNADLPLTDAVLKGSLRAESHPNLGTSTNYISRYWKVEAENIQNPDYDIEYVYAPGDPAGPEEDLWPAKYNTNGWQTPVGSGSLAQIGTGGVNPAQRKLTWSGLIDFSEFTALGNGSPLPVELIHFDAVPENQVVNLNWTTASELNNDYFLVQRSRDLNTTETIATVRGKGNSTQLNNYASVDASPYTGVSYYRLKQIDFNGDFEYSEWVAVYLNPEKVLEIRFISVDAENEVVAGIFGAQEELEVSVFDITGKLLTGTRRAGSNEELVRLSIPRSGGLLLIVARSGNSMVSRRFLLK